MKKLTIGTKRQADKVMMNSLFTPVNGRTLSVMKYDSGKYRITPDAPYIGREVEVSDDCHALYTVTKRDADGPYVQIMCVTA